MGTDEPHRPHRTAATKGRLPRESGAGQRTWPTKAQFHCPTRRIRRPLRDRETDTGIDRLNAAHPSQIEENCHHQAPRNCHRCPDAHSSPMSSDMTRFLEGSHGDRAYVANDEPATVSYTTLRGTTHVRSTSREGFPTCAALNRLAGRQQPTMRIAALGPTSSAQCGRRTATLRSASLSTQWASHPRR